MEENNKQQEFKKLAPKLKELLEKERQQATLPKDYFQNFEARLQQRIATEQSLEATSAPKEAIWRAWWQQFWKPMTAFALPALLLLFWIGVSPKERETVVDSFADLSTEVSSQEIDQYIEQNLEDFTLTDLLAMAEVEVLDTWQEGIIEVEPAPTPAPETAVEPASISSENSLEKALESTQSDDLLDELTTDDLSIEEDWF